jgi:hypothetical protein
MAEPIKEFRVIATKTTVRENGENREIHVYHATDGGPTILMIYGLAQLAAIIMAAQAELKEVEGE